MSEQGVVQNESEDQREREREQRVSEKSRELEAGHVRLGHRTHHQEAGAGYVMNVYLAKWSPSQPTTFFSKRELSRERERQGEREKTRLTPCFFLPHFHDFLIFPFLL